MSIRSKLSAKLRAEAELVYAQMRAGTCKDYTPLFTQLESGMSMMRYLPARGTAGFERSRVRG